MTNIDELFNVDITTMTIEEFNIWINKIMER